MEELTKKKLQSLGLTKSITDPNLYIKIVQNHPVILVLYVDDLFLIGEENLIAQTKRELSTEFEMKDLGLMHYFLGLEVWQKLGEIFLSQSSMQLMCSADLACWTISPCPHR